LSNQNQIEMKSISIKRKKENTVIINQQENCRNKFVLGFKFYFSFQFCSTEWFVFFYLQQLCIIENEEMDWNWCSQETVILCEGKNDSKESLNYDDWCSLRATVRLMKTNTCKTWLVGNSSLISNMVSSRMKKRLTCSGFPNSDGRICSRSWRRSRK
jgi:hypothetical protein